MTSIKYPRVVWGLPGGYLFQAELIFRFFYAKRIPCFPLGFEAVTMAIDGLNKMHATAASAWFFCVFASFLLIPDRPCAAMRHWTRHAIIDTTRTLFVCRRPDEAIALVLEYAFRHLMTYPCRRCRKKRLQTNSRRALAFVTVRLRQLNQKTTRIQIALTTGCHDIGFNTWKWSFGAPVVLLWNRYQHLARNAYWEICCRQNACGPLRSTSEEPVLSLKLQKATFQSWAGLWEVCSLRFCGG